MTIQADQQRSGSRVCTAAERAATTIHNAPFSMDPYYCVMCTAYKMRADGTDATRSHVPANIAIVADTSNRLQHNVGNDLNFEAEHVMSSGLRGDLALMGQKLHLPAEALRN